MIAVENLSYRYPGGQQVFRDLHFTIPQGQFVALLGENGAGKTTLLKQLNGLLKPTAGRVLVHGLDTTQNKISQLAKHIGFLFQNPDHQIFCQTVAAEIAFGLKNLAVDSQEIEKRVKQAAETVGLGHLLNSNPFVLSKGQRQRVALASVLAMQTEILVLDEPTTGQDTQEGIQLMETVKQANRQGQTVIMVTHDMELAAAYAARVIILHQGQILADGPTGRVLGKERCLAKAGLHSPEIYLLAQKFHEQGLFRAVTTVESMVAEIKLYLEGEANAGIG